MTGGRVIVIRGDAAHLPLPDAGVDLIVTSPPYWNLRDYRDGGESLKGQIGSSGTTALVASVLGRTGITSDLSADYCRIARWRTSDPAERARALGVPKPPPVTTGQGSLFDDLPDTRPA
jgi:DNA modification methylase